MALGVIAQALSNVLVIKRLQDHVESQIRRSETQGERGARGWGGETPHPLGIRR